MSDRYREALADRHARKTPAESIRNGLLLLMNPYYESHGVRIFTVQQVADMSRLFWNAFNQLEGRAD